MTTATETAGLTAYPTFIDLKEFVARARFEASGDPFGADRVTLPLRDAPVEITAIRLEAGSGSARVLPGDTFVVVVEGEVELASGGRSVRLSQAEAAVVSSGGDLVWSASGQTTLLAMRYTAGQGSAPGITPIDLAATLEPSGAPLAELLVGETPACRNHTDFRSADGVFTCGVWDSTPYHRLSMPYRHFELMVLLRGSVTFVDEADRSRTFDKGDIFLIEQGAQCSWDSREDVAKIYAIYRPLT